MALIKCPECEREVSDAAVACPGCEYPIADGAVGSSGKTPTPSPSRPETLSSPVTPGLISGLRFWTGRPSRPASATQTARGAAVPQGRHTETEWARLFYFLLVLACTGFGVWISLAAGFWEETERYYSSCPWRVRCPDGEFRPGYGFESPEYVINGFVTLLFAGAPAFIGHRLIKRYVLVSSFKVDLERRTAAAEAFQESLWKPLPNVVCAHCGSKGQVENYEHPPVDELRRAILLKMTPGYDPKLEAEARREQVLNQPNLRCKNCKVAWRDSGLSWKEPYV